MHFLLTGACVLALVVACVVGPSLPISGDHSELLRFTRQAQAVIGRIAILGAINSTARDKSFQWLVTASVACHLFSSINRIAFRNQLLSQALAMKRNS